MQGIGNGAGSDGVEAALAGDGKGGGDDLLAGESAGGCVAIVANKIPCVKGKFAIYSWIFSKASHFLHPDVMLGG